MSPENKEAAELFIPIRRGSRASSEETVSTSESVTTSTPSGTSPSLTSAVDSPRGRTAEVKTTHNSSVFVPSSGVKYTVSAPSSGAHSYNYRSSASSTEVNTADRPGGLHGGQRPTQPSSLILSKLKSARDIVRGVDNGATRTPSDHGSQYSGIQHTALDKPREQNILLPPRPSISARTSPGLEENRQDYIGMSSTRPVAHFATTTAGSLDSAYSSTPKSRIRTHSPESSHSSRDRTYPPGSFPDSFYQNRAVPIEGSSSPARTADRPPSTPKRRLNRSVYTISNIAVSNGDNRDPQLEPTAMSDFPKRSSLVPSPFRLERSASERVVVRTQAIPHTGLPNLSRSISSSSQKSTFHETIHHYEGCAHTCPPTTRPLDVQPVIKHLRTSSYATNSSVCSVIEGSCFDCDTSSRRDAETQILLKHTPELAELIAGTRYLLNKLETEDPTVIVQDKDTTNLHATRDRDKDIITESFELQIRNLEARIQQLTEVRDKAIKTVWRGYPARWGPGTLGVVKNPSNAESGLPFGTSTSTIQTAPTTPDTHQSRATYTHRRDSSRDSTGSRTTNTTATTMYRDGETPEGRMRVNWIRD